MNESTMPARNYTSEVVKQNLFPLQLAVKNILLRIPKEKARYREYWTGENWDIPNEGSLYILQLLNWGLLQPEVIEDLGGVSKASDLRLTLAQISDGKDPRITLLKLGLPGNKDEDLLADLQKEKDPVDAVLLLLNDWGNKIAEG